MTLGSAIASGLGVVVGFNLGFVTPLQSQLSLLQSLLEERRTVSC
jgi:hypothetical protein